MIYISYMIYMIYDIYDIYICTKKANLFKDLLMIGDGLGDRRCDDVSFQSVAELLGLKGGASQEGGVTKDSRGTGPMKNRETETGRKVCSCTCTYIE